MVMIMCDKCGHKQGFSPHTTKMKDGMERIYIVCEKCKEQYISYYTDKNIRELQARQRKIAKMIGRKQGEEYLEPYAEYKNNKDTLTIKMFELRRKVEQ